MSVQVVDGTPAGPAQPLFPHLVSFGYPGDWTLSPDGKRFLVNESAEPTSAPTRINVVANWVEELQAAADEERRRAK